MSIPAADGVPTATHVPSTVVFDPGGVLDDLRASLRDLGLLAPAAA
jgi:hypothetical protein